MNAGSSSETDTERDLQLDAVIGAFIMARDAGERPDPARWIVDHPEFARELDSFFGDIGVIDRVVRPRSFGSYRVVRLMKRGAACEVYEARRDGDDRRVVVKALHSHLVADADDRTRFEREIEAVKRLDHPNIVPLLDSGEEAGDPYLAMPYIEGEDLSQHIRNRARDRSGSPAGDRARDVAKIGVQAARALAHAHVRGVLHRDVKPSNLILGDDGRVHLTDFGLARTDEHSDLTRTGDVAGTLRYLAPERFRRWADPRSDLYGLGLTLYELLTLRPAFPDQDRVRLMRAMVEDRPKPPRSLDPTIPRDLETIVLKAIEREPADRYATGDAMAEDLERFLSGRPIVARRRSPLRRVGGWVRMHRSQAAGIALVATAIVCSIGVAFRFEVRRRHDAEQAALETARQNVALEIERGRADQSASETKYQNILLQIQQLRSRGHEAGWTRRIRKLAAQGAAIRNDIDLRSETVASFFGLDSELLHEDQRFGASSVAIDPTGRYILLGGLAPADGQDPRAKLWDQSSKRYEFFERTGAGPVAFLADGRPVELIVESSGLSLWDLRADRAIAHFAAEGLQATAPLALSPDGRFVAATVGSAVKLWDRSVEGSHEFPGHAAVLRFSADGRLLATGDDQGLVVVRSTFDGAEQARIQAGRTAVTCLAIGNDPERDPDGRRDQFLAVGFKGGDVALHRIGTSEHLRTFAGCDYDAHALEFSPDQTTLATAGHSQVILWDIATGRDVARPSGSFDASGLAFNGTGDILVVVDQSAGAVRVHRVIGSDGVRILAGLKSTITKAVYSPDESRIAALCHNWQVAVWDTRTGKLLHQSAVTQGLTADNAGLAISPDNSYLAFSAGRSAERWDVNKGVRVQTWDLPADGLVDQLAYPTPDRLLSFRAERIGGPGDPRAGKLRNLLAKDDPLRPIGTTPSVFPWISHAACSRDGQYFVIEGNAANPSDSHHVLYGLDGTTGSRVFARTTRNHRSGQIQIDPTGQWLGFMDSVQSDGSHTTVLHSLRSGRVQRLPVQNVRTLGPSGSSLLYGPGTGPDGGDFEYSLHTVGGGEVVHFGDKRTMSWLSPLFSRDGRGLVLGRTDGRVMVVSIPKMQVALKDLGLGW